MVDENFEIKSFQMPQIDFTRWIINSSCLKKKVEIKSIQMLQIDSKR
jgi:hypothetical protein